MDDLDIAHNRIGESAQRVVDRAMDEARRRGHTEFTSAHLFLAFGRVEWDTFAESMRDLDLNPHEVLKAIEDAVQAQPPAGEEVSELRASNAAKLVLRSAFHHASRAGRQTIESADVVAGILDQSQEVPVMIVRRHGVEPDALVARVATHFRDSELREEQLRKRFELPAALKNFAVNLNLLARQDKIPPVVGRDREIQQVLEILCHRERSNSVMLIGEPGVGKTAIVEGLARRIELEPETVPGRLRDCHIVNLQMNAVVAGTMLRGMFEERIHAVIKEIKEHPNLILFVDEAHTLVGAGSAIGAPADAANIFKSGLARGEVRMIGATTMSEYKSYIQEDEALARRFRTVVVPEPTLDDTRGILNGLKPRLERLYSVRLLDEAVETALALAPRYERHLHLPDKAIGWLDTAAVRAEMDRRWDVTASDVVHVVSDSARIPLDMVFRDVGERFEGIEARLGRPDRRPGAGGPSVGEPAGAEQGTAQGRLRSARWRAAVPWPDRRRQDRAGQGRRRVSVRRREEDDPHRHVRVPGRRRVGGQADRHAARHRGQRAWRRCSRTSCATTPARWCCSTRSKRPARCC